MIGVQEQCEQKLQASFKELHIISLRNLAITKRLKSSRIPLVPHPLHPLDRSAAFALEKGALAFRCSRPRERHLKAAIEQTIATYKTSTAQTLCAKMHASLPRELRDTVYLHVFGDPPGARTRIALPCACHRCCKRAAGAVGGNAAPYPPLHDTYTLRTEQFHDLQTYLAGTPTLAELLEAWCRTRCFYLPSSWALRPFLGKSLVGAGVWPRDHLLALSTDVEPRVMLERLERRETKVPYDAVSDIETNLLQLLCVRTRAFVCVVVQVHDVDVSKLLSAAYVDILESMFAVMQKLEEAGLRILIYPWWLGRWISIKRTLPLLCGPVPSVAAWVERAMLVRETMGGELDDEAGVDMTPEYWTWYRLLVCRVSVK